MTYVYPRRKVGPTGAWTTTGSSCAPPWSHRGPMGPVCAGTQRHGHERRPLANPPLKSETITTLVRVTSRERETVMRPCASRWTRALPATACS